MTEVVELYLAGVRTIAHAIAEPAVVERWDEPSALEEQTIGSLAGHLARTGTWIVGEYLGGGDTGRPVDFPSAALFYATLLPTADDPIHEGIRARGAALAAQGPAGLVATIADAMPGIELELRALPADATVAVTGDNVMTIDTYLVTRIVEQVVHLDDLARSVERDAPFPLPEESYRLVADVAVEVAMLRHPPATVVRALYRVGFADLVFPAI